MSIASSTETADRGPGVPGPALHVVFGAGPGGRAIARELSDRGSRVRLVNRSGGLRPSENVEVLAGDAGDPAFVREASAGADVIYECLNPGWNDWPTVFPRLQANLLEGAAAAEARYVSFENTWMYGRTHGRPLTEDLPHAPEGPNAAARAHMAEALLEAHRAGRVRATMGRASELFGPAVLGSLMGERVFPPALAGKPATVAGDPDTPHTYTYVPDLGRFLVTLGEREEALGHAWHLPSPQTVTTREFLEMVFAEAGSRPRIRRLPRFAVTALGLLNPRLRGAAEVVYQYEEPFVVDHSRFERVFGGEPTPLRDAIRATVAWFREHGSPSHRRRP